jgi:hypothetical protein
MILKKIFFLLFLAGFLFAGCHLINGDNAAGPPVNVSRLMIVNTSPNSPPLGLYVNGAAIFNNLTYADSTGYFQVGAGGYIMNIFRTDTTNYYQQDTTFIPTDSVLYVIDSVPYYYVDTIYTPTDTIVYQADTMVTLQSPALTLKTGFYYSLFLIDSVNKLQTTYISDSILKAPGADSVKLRFFHFSPNTPALDLAESGGGPVLFSNRMFNDVKLTPSYADFSYLPSGTYNFEIRLAGTSTVIATMPSVTLSGGKIYTLFAKGFFGGTGNHAPGIGIISNN